MEHQNEWKDIFPIVQLLFFAYRSILPHLLPCQVLKKKIESCDLYNHRPRYFNSTLSSYKGTNDDTLWFTAVVIEVSVFIMFLAFIGKAAKSVFNLFKAERECLSTAFFLFCGEKSYRLLRAFALYFVNLMENAIYNSLFYKECRFDLFMPLHQRSLHVVFVLSVCVSDISFFSSYSGKRKTL